MSLRTLKNFFIYFFAKSVDKVSKVCYNVTVDKMSDSFRSKLKTICR